MTPMRSPWVRLPLAVLFVVPVFFVQTAVWGALRPRIGLLQTAWVVGTVASLGSWAAYVLAVRWLEHRHAFEFGRRGAARELGSGLALGAALFATTIGVLATTGTYRVVATSSPVAALVPLASAIGAGVLEEVLFRGVLFRLIEEALGTWTALAVSSALFGFGHLMNPAATLQGVLAIAFEAGVLLGAAYLVTRRLWLAIGVHAGWNFTQSGIFGVPTSGFAMPGLLQGRLDGPVWLSGGAFGAEASVVALAVCTLAGLGLLRLAYRRGRFVAPAWRRTPRAAAAVKRATG